METGAMKNKNVGATGNGATFVLQTHEGIVKGFCLAISGHGEYVIIAKGGHFILGYGAPSILGNGGLSW